MSAPPRMAHRNGQHHPRIDPATVEHAAIARHPGALKPEELRTLAACGTVKAFRRQTVIVCEGDENDAFHLVLTGRVQVFVSDDQGREVVFGTYGPGEYFGAMVLDEGPRCASVITLEPSRIAIIPGGKFVEYLEKHPEVALKVLRTLVRSLRAVTQTVKALALMDVHERVAKLLDELASINGSRAIERLTQQEIANRVGASREMISRVMRDLTASGFIKVDKTHITILKRPRGH